MPEYELTPSEIEALTNGLGHASSPTAEIQLPPAGAAELRTRGAMDRAELRRQPSAEVGWDGHLQNVVRSVMNSFAAGAAAELEGPTRAEISIEVESIREMAYGEFVLRMDNPTCVQLLDVSPFDSQFVLELHPSILFPMFDRLLGGGQLPAPIVRRPLTDIEGRLTGRITRLLVTGLVDAWQPIFDVEVRTAKLLCNPRLLRSENPNERMVVTRFQMAIGDCQGPLQLALRQSSLVALRERLLAPPAALTLPTSQLAVVVAQLQLTPERLEQLQVGDVLISTTELGQAAVVTLDGQPRCGAKLGSFEGHKAIEICPLATD